MTKGFIIDVPEILIETKDNTTHIVTAKKGEVKLGGESIEINGGWSSYALAEIDTKKTLEVNISDAQWALDTMGLSTGGTINKKVDEEYMFGVAHEIIGGKIELTGNVNKESIKVSGMQLVSPDVEVEKLKTNEFKVVTSGDKTELVFAEDMNEKTVYPSYCIKTEKEVEVLSVSTKDFPQLGKVILKFPIYSEADKEQAEIIGHGQFVIYKAKIKPNFGFAGAYKTASEFALDLKGLDPRRSDKEMFKFSVIPA